MKLGVHIGYWGLGLTADDQKEIVQEAERLGYDSVWTAEAYGSDAATILGWLAQATERIRLGFGVTLTPFGFQSERRDLWSGQKTYLDMSPMLYADKMQGALLMYHGLEDQNVGTNPINAEFMFMALDGLGKPAALYMYPYEGHGPVGRETTLDMWARWTAWLDTYVKNPPRAKGRGGWRWRPR